MFLVDANRYASDSQGVTNRITNMLESHGAEIVASRPWDERRLAYPIKGHRKGVYLLTYFRLDGPELAEIDRECKLNEAILRQLILKVDRQLEEDLLAQAMAAQGEGRMHQEEEGGDGETRAGEGKVPVASPAGATSHEPVE
jgi:small subunit ribosomal protein S6